MIKNFTAQAFPLWAVEHGSDVTTLVIGWTLTDGVLSPVVVLQDELPTMAPFSLDGGSVVYSPSPWTPGRSAYWRNDPAPVETADPAPVTELWDAEGAQAETAALARPRSRQ